jgi:hypothetical protein
MRTLHALRLSVRLILLAILALGALASVGQAAVTPNSSDMRNVLSTTGEGNPNPAYGNRIRNLMIFQIGGWSGLPPAEVPGGPPGTVDPTWPLHWGVSGYLNKSSDVYLWQMHEIQALNRHTAVAFLMMPDEEETASGYGANFPGLGWQRTKGLFPYAAWAAWMKGVQVCPIISINCFDRLNDPNRGGYVLGKLQAFVNWYRPQVNGTCLKTIQGKTVILTEGLPPNTALSASQREAILNWMGQQTDILWIDNLAFRDDNPNSINNRANIYRCAAIAPPYPPPNPLTSEYAADGTWNPAVSAQDSLKAVYGSHYLWHFCDRFAKRESESWQANYKVGESTRLKWLNISPNEPNRYPVVISQWNEYAEFLIWEPNQLEGYGGFNYLQWRLSQQQ